MIPLLAEGNFPGCMPEKLNTVQNFIRHFFPNDFKGGRSVFFRCGKQTQQRLQRSAFVVGERFLGGE